MLICFRITLAIPPPQQNDYEPISRYSRCSMYNVNFTEVLMNGTITMADPTWKIQKCQYGWEYNFTDVPYATIATEV